MFWSVMAIIRKRKEYLSHQLVSTIIVVLFLIHPQIVKTMIALFSCTEIEKNDWWLQDEQDLRCWDQTHVLYILRISIPALIVWGLGVPCVSLALLSKNRKKLDLEVTKLKYGFLFVGYS